MAAAPRLGGDTSCYKRGRGVWVWVAIWGSIRWEAPICGVIREVEGRRRHSKLAAAPFLAERRSGAGSAVRRWWGSQPCGERHLILSPRHPSRVGVGRGIGRHPLGGALLRRHTRGGEGEGGAASLAAAPFLVKRRSGAGGAVRWWWSSQPCGERHLTLCPRHPNRPR